MHVLGIETSCDETAAAIVECSGSGEAVTGNILSNTVFSQFDAHANFGGVVPEIAARAHVSLLDHVVELALEQAKIQLEDVDLVAVTAGPGLVGGVMVGLMTAKAIAASRDIPFVAVNHLEGHALTARLTDGISFPYLLLLVSGGHTQIICVRGVGQYQRWATTIDDALGEAFDKTAKLLSLPVPGGPNVEISAKSGNPTRFAFPMPLKGQDTLNVSFSGLKTAVRQQAQKLAPLSDQDVSDICASFQDTVARTLADRVQKAMKKFDQEFARIAEPAIVIAGGVAANQQIRASLAAIADDQAWRMLAPPLNLCTDNGAMIAWAGYEQFKLGCHSDMDVAPRSRWPLDEKAIAVLGSGKKGTKA